MLSHHHVHSALELAKKLYGAGITLSAVPNSPLGMLESVTDKSIFLENSGLNKGAIVTEVDLERTIDLTNAVNSNGECNHCIKMEQALSLTVDNLLHQISYAKNQGAGLVEDLTERTIRALETISPFKEIGAKIVEVSIPSPLGFDNLVEEIEASRNTPYNNLVLVGRLPTLSGEEVRKYMKTDYLPLDEAIIEFFGEWDDAMFEKAWSALYCESVQVDSRVLSNAITNEHTLLFAYLTSRKLAMEIIPDVNMTPSQYSDHMSDIRNQTALRLCNLIDEYNKLDNNNVLIVSTDGLCVKVNKNIYQKYLKENGTPEAIFGAIISNDNHVTYDKIAELKDTYELIWNRKYLMNEQIFRNNKFAHFKDILISEYIDQTVFTPYSEFDANDRVTSLNLFKAKVDTLTLSDMDDVPMTCLKLLCASRLRNTSVWDILNGIVEAKNKDENVSTQEATAISIIQYVAKWVTTQMRLHISNRPLK